MEGSSKSEDLLDRIRNLEREIEQLKRNFEIEKDDIIKNLKSQAEK